MTVRAQRLDVIAVGDVSTDVFVRLLEDRVEEHHWPCGRKLVLPFGEKIPFEHVETVEAGGNAPNAAVAFARLGLVTALAAHVGGDPTGRDILAALHREGIDTRFVRIDPDMASNRNFVLWFRDDRTILVHHEEYDYNWPHLRPAEVPGWLYLSSVGTHGLDYYAQLADWLDAEPSVHLAFQPGTAQIALGADRLGRLYRRAEVVVCNREEAVTIGGGSHDDVAGLLESLRRLGPSTVVITDGAAGAYALDGEHRYRVRSCPDESPPVERTGAGDAFAATLVAALAQGCELDEALSWAPVSARSVVHAVGSHAGLLGEKELRNELERAHASRLVRAW